MGPGSDGERVDGRARARARARGDKDRLSDGDVFLELLGELRLVIVEELPPARAHRARIVAVLLVQLFDEGDVGAIALSGHGSLSSCRQSCGTATSARAIRSRLRSRPKRRTGSVRRSTRARIRRRGSSTSRRCGQLPASLPSGAGRSGARRSDTSPPTAANARSGSCATSAA